MSRRILVTGATGNVGRKVVRSLAAMDQPVIAAVLDDDDATNVPGDSVETVLFNSYACGIRKACPCGSSW